MQRGASTPLFLLVIAVGVGFIWYTGLHMPPLVASHFGTSGHANGFVSRQRYLTLIVCVAIILPLLVALPINLALKSPNAVINLPNRDYWLSAERRAETVNFLRRQMMSFGMALLVFVCYVHWLIVRANKTPQLTLSSASFVTALVALAVFVIVWIALHFNRFRNVP